MVGALDFVLPSGWPGVMNRVVTNAIQRLMHRDGVTDADASDGAVMAVTGSCKSIAGSHWLASNAIWMLAIVGLGLVARLFRIDHQPFWLDEALTFQRIHLDLDGLIFDSFSNRHMPTYFLLLRWMAAFFYLHDAWLRVPSAVFGAMSAGMVFAMACQLGGRSAGVVAGLLMALSPLQVQYGQEARSYALVTLFILISLWGLLRLTRDPPRAAIDVRHAGADVAGWLAYIFGAITALDVLGDAAPWLVASNLSLCLVWRTLAAESRKAFLRQWMGSLVFIMLCTVPFYMGILAASDGHMLQKFDWIPKLNWRHLWVVVGSVYLMRMPGVVKFDLIHTAVPLLGMMVVLAGCMGMFRMRKRLEGRVLLLSMLVLPLLVLTISLFKPMLLPRYILWSAAPFFVLAGLGAGLLPPRAMPMMATLLFLLGAVNLGPVYRMETKPRWDVAAATLAANLRPGDTVYTADPNAPTMLAVLKPKRGAPIPPGTLVTSQLDRAVARWKQGGRVWAVNGRSALGQREELSNFKTRMAALGAPAVEIPQGKEITILLFPPHTRTATD